jgi:hypothetical protein
MITPLRVTLEPESITKPARPESMVRVVVGERSPRNCRNTSVSSAAIRIRNTVPTVFSGGRS